MPPTVAATAPTTPAARPPLAAGATTTIVVTNGSRTLPTTLTIPPGARPWPTVVFAAGYDIEPGAYEQLTHSWAAAGYLVAAPASPGMAPSQGPVTEAQLPDVPGDLSAVATRLVADGLADPARLAAVGHSDGASAVGALALTADHADARFRAFVVLAGDITTLPDSYGPRNAAPLLAATGDADEFNNAVLTPQLYGTAAAPKALVVAHGGSHLGSFLGDTPQATAMRAAITDFLGASLRHGSWSPLAALNGEAGLTVTSSGLPG
jgi:dienelactone hydrolase